MKCVWLIARLVEDKIHDMIDRPGVCPCGFWKTYKGWKCEGKDAAS